MINGKKIVVILPAFNAERTIAKTFRDIPHDIIDEIVLTDDLSTDNTVEIARNLGINHVITHKENKGYGANQKTCYDKALSLDADIILMLHADYQYDPRLILAMGSMVGYEVYDVVIGSRILGKGALKGGMPIYKYLANRFLTAFQNIMMGQKLSEYHTGYRCFKAEVLKKIPYNQNSDDFVFDNEILAQILYSGSMVGEVSCPTRYFDDASSINFARSVTYGLGVLGVSLKYFLHKTRLLRFKLFNFQQD